MPKRVALPIQGHAGPPERVDAARNRVRILAAARKLLAKRPIEGICMDELARAAGVGKGTIFRRFVDRASLCLALLDENERALQEKVLADFELPATATPYERLTVFLDALFAFQLDNASLLSEVEAFKRAEDRFGHPVHAWRQRELARRIQRAANAGAVRPGDIEITVDLILASLGADLLLWQIQRIGSREELHRRIHSVWERLLQRS